MTDMKMQENKYQEYDAPVPEWMMMEARRWLRTKAPDDHIREWMLGGEFEEDCPDFASMTTEELTEWREYMCDKLGECGPAFCGLIKSDELGLRARVFHKRHLVETD